MPENEDDHSLLIRVDQKLDDVTRALSDLKTAMEKKADQNELARLEKLIDKNEAESKARFVVVEKATGDDRSKLYMIIGGVAVIEFMASFVIALLTGHLKG